jgi:prepilin peptidase CpaA
VIVLAAVAAGTGTGALIDLRTRRIPNPLTIGIAALGLTLAAADLSGVTVASSLGGFLLGMLLMLPGHALGATGAGDVKLLAAVGAVLGAPLVVTAFLYTAIAGGVLAVAYALSRKRLGTTVRGTMSLMTAPGAARDRIQSAGLGNRFPYGPAIAIGSMTAAWLGR